MWEGLYLPLVSFAQVPPKMDHVGGQHVGPMPHLNIQLLFIHLWIIIIQFIVRAFSICLALHPKQINVYKRNELEKKINKIQPTVDDFFSNTEISLCVRACVYSKWCWLDI